MEYVIIVGAIVLAISLILNISFIAYFRKFVPMNLVTSEHLSEIYAKVDAFRNHIKIIRKLTIYTNDDTILKLREHLNDLLKFLQKYEESMSLVNPNLLEELEESEEYGTEEEEGEREKIFHSRTSGKDSDVLKLVRSKVQEQDL